MREVYAMRKLISLLSQDCRIFQKVHLNLRLPIILGRITILLEIESVYAHDVDYIYDRGQQLHINCVNVLAGSLIMDDCFLFIT